MRAIALPNERGTIESEFLSMFGRPAMDTACQDLLYDVRNGVAALRERRKPEFRRFAK